MATPDPNLLHPPLGYICPRCETNLYGRYLPFCGGCGCTLPPEEKLQLLGLTIYHTRYVRPIVAIEEIATFLRERGIVKHWLQDYSPTFRTTKIRIPSDEIGNAGHEIICTSTIRLELPIDDGWYGTLSIEQQSEHHFCLSDQANEVLVEAGQVYLYQLGDV